MVLDYLGATLVAVNGATGVAGLKALFHAGFKAASATPCATPHAYLGLCVKAL